MLLEGAGGKGAGGPVDDKGGGALKLVEREDGDAAAGDERGRDKVAAAAGDLAEDEDRGAQRGRRRHADGALAAREDVLLVGPEEVLDHGRGARVRDDLEEVQALRVELGAVRHERRHGEGHEVPEQRQHAARDVERQRERDERHVHFHAEHVPRTRQRLLRRQVLAL